MAPFIDVFEFFYNNFIVVGIIVLSITLFFLVIRMFYLEYRFNKHLSMRKLISRNLERYRNQQLTLRRFLGLALPVALIVLIVIQAFNTRQPFDDNSVVLENEGDVIRIYENFFGKFLTTPIQPNILEPTEMTEATRVQQINTYENFDFVARTRNQIFILNSNGVDVVAWAGDESTHDQRLDLIELSCEAERFVPEGMFIHDNLLVVAVSFASGQCEDRVIPYHLREHSVDVFVFDISDSDIPLIERFSFSGILTSLRQQSGEVLLSTTTYLAFANPNFSLNRALPRVTHERETHVLPIQGMRYVEGTVPNSFVAVHQLNIKSSEVQSTGLLTDFNHQLRLSSTDFVLMADSYVFAQASEIFELRNPVERMRTGLSQFRMTQEGLEYHGTQLLDGQKQSFGLKRSENQFIVITRETIHYRIYVLDHDLDVLSQSLMLPRFVIDDVLYHQNHLYFLPLSPLNPIIIFGQDSSGSFEQVRELNNIFLLDFITRIHSNYILGASNLQNNMININLIQQVTPSELSLVWQDIINYADFGYRLEEDRNPLQDVVTFTFESTEYLLLPLQSGAALDFEAPTQTAMVLFEMQEEALLEVMAFRLGGLEAFRYPFSYRYFAIGDTWVHITPGGVILSPLNDLSQRTVTIRFNP